MRLVDKLREESESNKQKYTLFISAGIFVVVLMLWIFSGGLLGGPQGGNPSAGSDSASQPLKVIGDIVGDVFSGISGQGE